MDARSSSSFSTGSELAAEMMPLSWQACSKPDWLAEMIPRVFLSSSLRLPFVSGAAPLLDEQETEGVEEEKDSMMELQLENHRTKSVMAV